MYAIAKKQVAVLDSKKSNFEFTVLKKGTVVQCIGSVDAKLGKNYHFENENKNVSFWATTGLLMNAFELCPTIYPVIWIKLKLCTTRL